MGFNSVVVILNDGLIDIENDKDYGKKVSSAVSEVWDGKKVNVSSSGFVNCTQVISTAHADCTQLVAVGRNSAEVLDISFNNNFYTDQGKIEILKSLADKL